MSARAHRVRVLLISEHEVVRKGLRLLLESRPGLVVVGEVASWAAGGPASERPEVILLDAGLGAANGLDCIPALLAVPDPPRVLILTGLRDAGAQQQALRLGARGFVYKDDPAEVLFKAIEKVHAGELWIDRAVLATLLDSIIRAGDAPQPDPEAVKIARLTERERGIIGLVGQGLRNKRIAERLCISETTVRHHLTSIYDKLGVSGRLELMIYAYRHSLATPPPERSDEGKHTATDAA
jgi:DNA-binding NarL/FixJ family response regulator